MTQLASLVGRLKAELQTCSLHSKDFMHPGEILAKLASIREGTQFQQ